MLKGNLIFSFLLMFAVLASLLSCSAPRFEVVSLDICPKNAMPGEAITVKAEVINFGGASGIYSAVLRINGVPEVTQGVTVAPGDMQTVWFTVSKNKPGSYLVSLGLFQEYFRVIDPTNFAVSNLCILPPIAGVGQKVIITVDVVNDCEVEDIYRAILVVNGTKVEAKETVVAAGAKETVSFSLVKDKVGVYTLGVGALNDILIVESEGTPLLQRKLAYTDSDINIYDITYLSDGLRVGGCLAEPSMSGVYPAIIWNRGGSGEVGLLHPFALAPYARNGYVAIGSQYRGNGGSEGQEEFGGADINDVLNLVPILRSLPNVDDDRIGMVGYSRGGMMTYLALKEQSLGGAGDIKAACTVGAITDLFMTARLSQDMLSGVLVPLIGGTPEEVPEKYEARSAVCWADKIDVPLLIMHGEADSRVSVEQAKELARQLEKLDKAYSLMTYPGEEHDLPGHEGGIAEIFAWFEEYLR